MTNLVSARVRVPRGKIQESHIPSGWDLTIQLVVLSMLDHACNLRDGGRRIRICSMSSSAK